MGEEKGPRRLEKVLEEEGLGLKKTLEWCPVVEEPGDGCGDGKAVALEVRLETGRCCVRRDEGS
jgi:hypothetical protein